jgi:thiol-disulfide isomerase/thioredoxin
MFRRRPKPLKLESMAQLEELAADGKPIFIDFFQENCRSCRIMDGIVNELAAEYDESAHVVKVDVGAVAGAVDAFKIRSTPTFVILGSSMRKPSKKARKRAAAAGAPAAQPAAMSPRWRASGLVHKDVLERALESNGAARST